MASDVRIWTGTAWESIKGPKGDPGPTEVSAEVGNSTRLGSDGKVYTPTPVIPIGSTTVRGTVQLADAAAITAGTAGRVVDAAQLRTVSLSVPAASAVAPIVDGAAAAVGTATAYARADHVHPRVTPADIGAAAATHTHTAGQVTGLATVATSGSYNDLSNRPTIPAAYTLPVATAAVLGGVKQGAGVTIAADGTITAAASSGLPVNNPTYTGRIAGPDGTLAAPSYTFTNDTDTGLFRVTDNVMQIVAGGKSAIQVSDTGYMQFYATVLEMISSVAFAPSIQIRNTNTDSSGCYFNLEKRPTGNNALALGTELGSIQFSGVDNQGNSRMGALVRAVVDGQGGAHCAADFVIFTTNILGAAGERFRISSDGVTTIRTNLTAQGTVNTFAAQSINSNAIGPLTFNTRLNANGTFYTFALTDAGRVVINANTTAASFFTIPGDATTNFPIGTVIEVIDNSDFDTFVQGAAGVTIQFNALVGSTPSFISGIGKRGLLLGRISSCRCMKAAANTWWLFGELKEG
jgi:hypothetical protein